jgi:predicted amidophosphoribosyltransferase
VSRKDPRPREGNPLQELSLQRAMASAKEGKFTESLDWLRAAGPSPRALAIEAEVRYGLAKELGANEQWIDALREFAHIPRDSGVPSHFIEERQSLIRRRDASPHDVWALQQRFRSSCTKCADKNLYAVATCPHQIAPIQPALRLNVTSLAPSIAGIYAAGAYRSGWDRNKNDALSLIVRREKERIDEQVLRLLGVVLAEYVRHRTPLLKHVDLIVPVPTSRDRAGARGGSIPYSFAETLQDVLAVPMRAAIQLVAEYDGHAVVSGDARSQALRRAWRAERTPILKHSAVLLVDDIVTTGTTLSVAAELLLEVGVRAVYAVALLHTEKST